MMTLIKNYLLLVLIKAILNYILLALIVLVVFGGYALITDWASMIKFATEIRNNEFAKIILWLPLVLALFNKVEGNFNNENTKRYKETEHFFEMYDTIGMKW
ncbi:MAG: hypothetical protein R3331_05305 [Sulfurospirillaceae bacterium]|nr:hypothetical protein [Sulfurospirillaceae bacterium]